MARNKYPEETVNKIVDVSMNLFLEKGFENTSMQDIVDNLGGLSKGAIYHHFKSKDDILAAVMDKIYAGHDNEWIALQNMDDGLTGLEKMKAVFAASIYNERQDEVFAMAPNFIKNPQMLAMQIQGIYEEGAPKLLQPIIEQGVADGTIKTDHPKELAEVLLLLINIWLTPVAHADGSQDLEGRIGYFREMLDKLGLPIFDDAMYQRIQQMAGFYDCKDQAPTP